MKGGKMSYVSNIVGIIEHHMAINNLIYILLIIIGGMIIIRLSDRFLSKVEEMFEFDVTAHYLLKDIVKYLVIVVAFAWILNVLGINLESIVISLGVVGIAIGIALSLETIKLRLARSLKLMALREQSKKLV